MEADIAAIKRTDDIRRVCKIAIAPFYASDIRGPERYGINAIEHTDSVAGPRQGLNKV
jgi:hypothetical protein